MYKLTNQITVSEFISPFGKLNPENRWVKIANMIPWEKYEPEYMKQFCDNNGAPATPFRTALGTLIIKQITGHSDEETLQDIIENPYMQFLIGLHEFTEQAPFSATSITNFRKYISQDMLNRINEDMFAKNEDDSDDDGSGDFNDDESTWSAPTDAIIKNKGELILDATCVPSNIAFPTDINLLNKAREKTEEIIDILHEHSAGSKKPRTYRKIARKNYISYIKNKRTRHKKVRKVIKKQLSFVKRNLGHIDNLLSEVSIEVLNAKQQRELGAIQTLYNQQQEMYDKQVHSVADRIVSLSQDWVRPIVRGKANANVEFGAKVNASVVSGFVFIDNLEWNAYNEAVYLTDSIETYKRRFGVYPEAVLVDKLYRNRANVNLCKSLGIRISGPALGRPKKETEKATIEISKADASIRNQVEGKFGEAKTKYGLSKIKSKLKLSCQTEIAISFLCMNINKKLRLFVTNFSGKAQSEAFMALRYFT